MMGMNSIDGRLRSETEAARVLIAGIRDTIGDEDLSLLADAIEGETDLLEAIDVALSEIDEMDVLISGLKEKEEQFSRRRRAMEERVRRFRALIEQAMAITDQSKLRRPAATLTLRRLPPDVVVLAEADIPADFFVPQPPPPPKLDKAALRAALLEHADKVAHAARLPEEEREQVLAALPAIPGASLNNGSLSLQIRRS
jgi:hypothetical protein